MATPNAAQYVNAGGRASVELTGSIPSYLPDSIFRERLNQQLTMQGFFVESIQIESGYGLTARDYRAIFGLRLQASTLVSNLIGLVRDAAEGAGSYSPSVTVPSVGQPVQPNLPRGAVEKAAEQIIGAVGSAAEGVGAAPKRLFDGINIIVIGLVVIVGLVAFGPNVKDVAKAAR